MCCQQPTRLVHAKDDSVINSWRRPCYAIARHIRFLCSAHTNLFIDSFVYLHLIKHQVLGWRAMKTHACLNLVSSCSLTYFPSGIIGCFKWWVGSIHPGQRHHQASYNLRWRLSGSNDGSRLHQGNLVRAYRSQANIGNREHVLF